MKKIAVALISSLWVILAAPVARTETIHVDVSAVLNVRPVTTLSGGKLVTWSGAGVGFGAGYMTLAASLFNGDRNPKALPDDPRFPASAQHPEFLLHYSNDDGVHPQARKAGGIDTFSFPVPAKAYGDMFLFLTCSEGACRVSAELTYTDGTETRDLTVPDFWNDIPAGNPNIGYVIRNLAKWNSQNMMVEISHHNIFWLDLRPAPARTLVGIKITKSIAAGNMIFWGATGLTADSVIVDGGVADAMGAGGATTDAASNTNPVGGAGGGGGGIAQSGGGGTTGAGGATGTGGSMEEGGGGGAGGSSGNSGDGDSLAPNETVSHSGCQFLPGHGTTSSAAFLAGTLLALGVRTIRRCPRSRRR